MATWKCLGCDALYMAPKEWGGLVPHACPPIVDPKTNALRRRPGHRDENMTQDRDTGTVTIAVAGAGRILIDEEDVLFDLTPERIVELRARAPLGGAPHPEPLPRAAKVWPAHGSDR